MLPAPHRPDEKGFEEDELERETIRFQLLCFGINIASLREMGNSCFRAISREEEMTSPDYIRILKLDKLALKSKTYPDFLQAVKGRLQYAKNLGVEGSFPFFVERAWGMFGDGK